MKLNAFESDRSNCMLIEVCLIVSLIDCCLPMNLKALEDDGIDRYYLVAE